jgi:hypothetical protein
MTALLLIGGYALLLAWFHVWNELRIYRRGGDVYEWTRRLARRLIS